MSAAPGSPPSLSAADRDAAARLIFAGSAAGNAAGAASGNLDRLAALAARLLRAPSAQVSLLAEVQTVLGSAGLPEGTTGTQSPLADSLCTVTSSLGEPLVVENASDDHRVKHLPPVTTGAVGSYLGIPLVAHGGGRVGALCVFGPGPRAWSSSDVDLLTEIAASTIVELELSALGREIEADRARWELAIDAAGVGSFDWDLLSGRLVWDERLIELFGYEPSTFDESIEAFNTRLHPDDLPRVTRLLDTAIETCGEYDAEYRIVLPDGSERWVAARGRALCGVDGRAYRLLGAAYDTTAVRDGEARVARVLETMPTAFFSLDADWRFNYVNAEAERVLGRQRSELLGSVLWDQFPHAVGTDFEQEYRNAVANGQPTSFEAKSDRMDAWFQVRAWPGPLALSVYFHDITEQRHAQHTAAAAARRTELLARVADELVSNLPAEDAVSRLAQCVVPDLGDWCIVSLLDRPKTGTDDHGDAAGLTSLLRDIGSWHADPDQRGLVARYSALRLEALRDASLLEQALRGAEPVTIAHGAADVIARRLAPGEARDLMLRLAPDRMTAIALRAHGQPLGLLTVFHTRPPADQDWVTETLHDVAARAGLALDNGRLYAAQRRLSEDLQRSLLSAPPEPDHLEIRTEYRAAQALARVGGDWYDAFLQPNGATMLVIGDVVGHDTQAAAEMGQIRALLRGIAVTTSEGPAGVLTRLDSALQTLQIDTTATVAVLRIEQDDDDRRHGITRIRWSSAGHPPPILMRPREAPRPLLVTDAGSLLDDADLLLGVDPLVTRREGVLEVPRGSTLLLYTDGLIERRGESLEEGLSRLVHVLATPPGAELPLTDLVRRAMTSMSDAYDDDVAVVAVRLHPQDRPRPAEAGPARTPTALPPYPQPTAGSDD